MSRESLRYDDPPAPAQAPPHNHEAEAAVLGSVLLDRDVIDRVSDGLHPEDFYREANGLIYAAMLALAGRGEPVDYVTLIDELGRAGLLDRVGGTTYVAGLVGVVPTPIHAERYAARVAEAAFARRMISVGGAIAMAAQRDTLGAEDLQALAEGLLASVALTRKGADLVPIVSLLRDQRDLWAADWERLKADPSAQVGRLPTGFAEIDELLGGGFERGEVVLLAGRPGHGKSSLMLNLITGMVAARTLRVAVFSLEMTALQLVHRLTSSVSGVPIRTLQRGLLGEVLLPRLVAAEGELAMADILFDETPGQHIAAIRARAKRAQANGGLDVVVVDHVQLAHGNGNGSVEELTDVSHGLKSLAKDLGVVVVAACQLNRAIEKRATRRPILSDLQGASALEQDADVVMFLDRPELYDPLPENGGLADLFVDKNRNGRTGDLKLTWNGMTTTFRGMETYRDVR